MLQFNNGKVSLLKLLWFFEGLRRSPYTAFQLKRKPKAHSSPQPLHGWLGRYPALHPALQWLSLS